MKSKGPKQDPKSQVSCTICGDKYRRDTIQKHVIRHALAKKNHACRLCDKSFLLKTKLIIHLKKSHGEGMHCDKCEKTFSSMYRFIAHMKNHGKEMSMSCDVCEYATNNRSVLHTHRLVRHKIGEYPLYCEVCKKGFLSKGYLVEHMNTHTGATPHQCHICGATFAKNKALEQHSYRLHPQQFNILRCPLCRRVLKSQKSLTAHMAFKHGENSANICETCGKIFSFKESLIRHRRIHTGEKPKECSVCKKRFTCASALQTHMRTHTGERPYECKFCGKRFSQRTPLVTHEKTHVKGLLSSGLHIIAFSADPQLSK